MQMIIRGEDAGFAPQAETINSRVERLVERAPVILTMVQGGGRQLQCETRRIIVSNDDYYFFGKQRRIVDPASLFKLPLVRLTRVDYLGPEAELFYQDEVRPRERTMSALGLTYTPPRELEDENIIWDEGQRCHRRRPSAEFTKLLPGSESSHVALNPEMLALVCEKVGDVIIDQYQATLTQ